MTHPTPAGSEEEVSRTPAAQWRNPYAGMTTEQLEAAFTAEDPRYPARKAAAEALHKFIDQWIKEYELDDGEGGYHAPSEFERFLIADAFAGLTGDDEYQRLRDAWHALCGPTPSPSTLRDGV